MGASTPWAPQELVSHVERLLAKLDELTSLLEEERRALLDGREDALPALARRTKSLLCECETAQREVLPHRPMLAREPLDALWREVQTTARTAQRLNELNSLLLAIPQRGTHREGEAVERGVRR